MTPISTGYITPPLQVVVKFYRTIGGPKHRRTSDEVLGWGRGELLGRRFDLGDGDVAGGFDKFTELRVGHFGCIHPESIDVHTMDRHGIVGDPGESAQRLAAMVAPHRKLTTGNPHHSKGCRVFRPIAVFFRRLKPRQHRSIDGFGRWVIESGLALVRDCFYSFRF